MGRDDTGAATPSAGNRNIPTVGHGVGPHTRGTGTDCALRAAIEPDRRTDTSAATEQPPRLHRGIKQEVAPNESQKDPKATTREALISEAFFVARWLSC